MGNFKSWWHRLTEAEKEILIEMLYEMSEDEFREYGVGFNEKEEYAKIGKDDL